VAQVLSGSLRQIYRALEDLLKKDSVLAAAFAESAEVLCTNGLLPRAHYAEFCGLVMFVLRGSRADRSPDRFLRSRLFDPSVFALRQLRGYGLLYTVHATVLQKLVVQGERTVLAGLKHARPIRGCSPRSF
jgi:hypothetical protein